MGINGGFFGNLPGMFTISGMFNFKNINEFLKWHVFVVFYDVFF